MENNKKNSREAERKSGLVTETFPGAHFLVKIDGDKQISAHLAGKLRLYRIKILPGDRVTVELSPYDKNKGRIIYREK